MLFSSKFLSIYDAGVIMLINILKSDLFPVPFQSSMWFGDMGTSPPAFEGWVRSGTLGKGTFGRVTLWKHQVCFCLRRAKVNFGLFHLFQVM